MTTPFLHGLNSESPCTLADGRPPVRLTVPTHQRRDAEAKATDASALRVDPIARVTWGAPSSAGRHRFARQGAGGVIDPSGLGRASRDPDGALSDWSHRCTH